MIAPGSITDNQVLFNVFRFKEITSIKCMLTEKSLTVVSIGCAQIEADKGFVILKSLNTLNFIFSFESLIV